MYVAEGFVYAQQCPECDSDLEIQRKIYGTRFYFWDSQGLVQEDYDYTDEESDEVVIFCNDCGHTYAEGVSIKKSDKGFVLSGGVVYE